MSKKRKKDSKMIDMSFKCNIRIVSSSEEDDKTFYKELEELDISVEKRMERYEARIRATFQSALSEELITVTDHDSSYFINTYGSMIENRNDENIKKRIAQYQAYLPQNNRTDAKTPINMSLKKVFKKQDE